MKYAYLHVSLAAVALAAFGTLERAGAVTAQGGGGGGGSNWYLRAPDGSSQGPYGLSQLGEWSRAGYVSADSQVRWGAGGPPQALSSVLGAGGGAFGGALAGGVSSEDGGGGGGGGGRRGDDDTSEEGGYDYRAAASSQLWGDDSEEEQPYRPTGGRGSARPGGGARDEWGSLMSEKVTAVEGGRWSESVSAAKGTFKKLFTVGRKSGNRRKRVNGGRGSGRGRGGGRSRGGGGRYPPGARDPGRGDRGYPQGRGSSYGASPGSSGDGGWNSGGRGSGFGQGGGEWGGVQGAGGVNQGDSWQTNFQGSSAQPLSQQQQQQDLGEGGGVSPPPPPPATAAYPPPPPPVPSPISPELRDGEGGGQGQGVAWDAAGSGNGGGGGGVASPSPIPEEVAPLPPPPNTFPGQMPPSTKGYSPSTLGSSGAAHSSPAAPAAGAAMGGLDPSEIEAFYAAQKEYGADSGPAAGDAQSRKRMGWGRRGKDIPKEDLTAMGLNYGEADREPVRERPPRRRGRSRWFGFAKGSRGRREVLGGRVSVDSMKLKYEEGWNVEAEGEGVFAAVKSVAGRSISRMTSPSKAVTSMTPVAGVRLLARAGGGFPLLLWWAFSVMRGVLPVVMSWLVSRLMHQLADFSAGRYTLSTSHYRECRSACFKLLGQQAGAGLSLAVAAGVVRGWLRPRAQERSAALCRRALAGVSVAGGIDRPQPSEFRELSLAPWSYMQQVMELSRGVAGVAAVVAVLQTVWPFRGPVTLGGGAAVLLLLEGIRTLLATEDPGAAKVRGSGSDVAEPSGGIHGGASGGAVASAEAEARGLRQVLLSKNSAVLEAAEHHEGRKSRIITTRSVVRGSVTWLVMAAFAVYALVSVVEEELAFQFGTARVTLVITQVWLAYASLQGALNGLGQVARLRPTAARMQAIALARPESGGGGKDTGLGTEGGWSNDGPEADDGLRLQGVSFRPSGRTRQALSSVDLHAPAGSVVAVLGGAGAGKTALLQLALGLIKADEGEAIFQGRPLQEWETGAYRERVAWLSQASLPAVSGRFGLTAGENIGAGDPSEFSNRELWARAAGLSGANTAIESLPLGYDTLLEDGGGPAAAAAGGGGSGLSEGEWQRLQLARFLMRADVAKLLLLDEPFKGVSPSEASRMLAALGAQARATGQVVVVASQDLSLGRWADATVYLEDGSVSESGRWDDLLASGGPFATAIREHDAF
ncbi:unnamed protein product [Ectocarpus sp. 4 AP-2014]